jgi:hypothetical protein
MSTLFQRFVSLVAHVLAKAVEEFRKLTMRTQVLAGFLLFLFVFMVSTSNTNGATGPSLISSSATDRSRLKVLSWNIAAINNNPFEYWLTLKDDPKYDDMMNNVELFVLNPPPKKDQLVSQLLTPEMFEKLAAKMTEMKMEHVDKVREMYQNDWSQRKIVSDFLKDQSIGKKRLVSMPDRITNTIITSKGSFYRPTPINCYDGPRFQALNTWFDRWLSFMFETKVTEEGQVPAQLLEKIPRAKYPALSEEEEQVSIPLQTLVIAIFDGIQVRMLNQIAGSADWQDLRDRICTNLNRKKSEKTLGVLYKSYADANIMFLQEAASSFMKGDTAHLSACPSLEEEETSSN